MLTVTAGSACREELPVPDRARVRRALAELAPLTDQLVVLGNTPKLPRKPGVCLAGRWHPWDCLFKPLGPPRSTTPTSPRPPPRSPAPRSSTRPVDLLGLALCPAVVGNVLPYRDRGHLTTVYAESLADELTEALGLSKG